MDDDRAHVQIRRIRPTEGAMLRAVRLRGLQEAPEAFGQTAEDAAERPHEEWQATAQASAAGDRRAWFVAERRGATGGLEPAGIVLGRRRPPDTVLIFSMWVEPAMRRSGIGRGLIETVEAWALSWGAQRTVLWVFAANESALRFYTRLGFVVEDSGHDAGTGARYGALAMTRTIGAESGANDRHAPIERLPPAG